MRKTMIFQLQFRCKNQVNNLVVHTNGRGELVTSRFSYVQLKFSKKKKTKKKIFFFSMWC